MGIAMAGMPIRSMCRTRRRRLPGLRRTVRGAALACVAALSTTVPARVAGAVAVPEVRVIVAPAERSGERFMARLVVDGGQNVAGFSANLRFDSRAIDVAAVQEPAALPGGGGGALEPLSVVETPNRQVVAGWSCTGKACAHRATAPNGVARVTLASLVLEPLRAGDVELRVDGITLVDAAGRTLPVRADSTSVSVRIGGGSIRYLAPAGAATPLGAGSVPTDVDGDGRVTVSDVTDLVPAWIRTSEFDRACPRSSASCVTIADLQYVASLVTTAPNHPADPAATAASITFTVNSTNDAPDAKPDGICQTATAGQCTLRAAIQEANRAVAPVTIAFDIAGTGIHTIKPGSALPAINNANGYGITIDGFTQPGSSPNTDLHIDNAVRTIELVGQGASGIDGFFVLSANNTIRGLNMHAFDRSVWLYGTSANDNTVVGNLLGLTPTGNYDPTYTLYPQSSCVVIQQGAGYNQIGAPGAGNRNTISGCNHQGVATYNWPTPHNVIQNNIVGLDPTGTQRRGNKSHGVDINTGTQWTLIGGTGSQQSNLLSGNFQEGTEISHNPLTQHNSVVGNLIGTDPTGNNAPSYAQNGQWGVHLEGYPNCGSSACPLDEGYETVTNNVIVDSAEGGIMVDKGVHDSTIADNKIGLTANGTPGGNKLFGVNINAGSIRTLVGPGNEIAYNASGVQIQSDGVEPPDPASMLTNQNTITQNSIHDNATNGVAALGIDLAPFGTPNTAANCDPNVNDCMVAPTLSNPHQTSVDVATCARCTIELFLADRAAGAIGAGKTFLTSAVADSTGTLHLFVPSAALGKVVTATATNPNGSTSEFARNVAIPNTPPGDVPPVARVTASCNQLTCTFDGSSSSDSDGTIVHYDWAFGDATTGTAASVAHTYAAPGTYTAQLTVTDNGGLTNSTTSTNTVSVTNGVVALDAFQRTVSNGWANADYGGAYTLNGAASDYSVGGGVGSVTINTPVNNHYALLAGVSVLDSDAVVDIGTTLTPTGGTWGQVGYLTARHVATNTEYRARLRFPVGGGIKLSIIKVVGNNTEVQIGNEVTIAGLSYAPGQMYTLRFDVTGTNPTTLQAKVWVAGTSEPSAWNLAVTDSQPELQSAGAPGVRAYLGVGATNAPTWQFDNLQVKNLG
jgi:CSLREA domain-containing protein